MNKFVAIEGVIGVGKTTLARLLAPHFSGSLLLEVFEENPFLPLFYGDKERYAFQTQIFFLLSRYHQQRRAVPEALRQGVLLSDYTFAKDEIFAWLNLKDDELAMYGRVHAALAEKLPRPDLIVFLHASHDVLMRRIALRDRPYERDMDPDYIRDVSAAYDAWLTHLDGVPVLRIDTDDIDFLSREDDLLQIVERVRVRLLAPTAGATASETRRQPVGDESVGQWQAFFGSARQADAHDAELGVDVLRLAERLGAVAGLMGHLWTDAGRAERNGLDRQEAYRTAMSERREPLAAELADLLARIMMIAGAAGIDLEEALTEHGRAFATRTWARTNL